MSNKQRFAKVSLVFLGISNYCISQLSIVDPRFEVGYTGCSFQTTSQPIQNLNFDGIPSFKEFVTNCNYNSEDDASKSCPNQGVSNLESWFSVESAYWKEADHKIDRGVRDADWIRLGCDNIYLTTFCPLLYSSNEYPKGNFMLLQSELVKCKNKNDYKPNRKFHDALRISFSEGKFDNGEHYVIRFRLATGKSWVRDAGQWGLVADPILSGQPPNCVNHLETAHLRTFITKKSKNWNTGNPSERVEIVQANVIRNYNTDGCQWEYIERQFTVPAQGDFQNLVLYMESGAFFIDEVEVFKVCTPEYYVQTRTYSNNSFTIKTELGLDYVESAGQQIYAVRDIGAENVPIGDVKIAAGAEVTFKGGERILLKPGFKVESGAKFIAKIEPCSSHRQSDPTNTVLFDYLDLRDGFEELSNLENDSNAIIAIDDDHDDKFEVFPNPSDGTFVVEIKDTYDEINAVYSVYDLSGRVVQQGTVTPNKANLFIAQKGVLILEVTCNQNEVHRQRIVVF